MNSNFIDRLTDELQTIFMEQQITLPHRLKQQKGWVEVDYIQFWMYYLSCIKPADILKYEDHLNKSKAVDLRVFNDHSLGRDARLKEYKNLLKKFTDYIKRNKIQINPISTIALMPDHHYSLGCSLERELGLTLGITLKEIYFDKKHPRYNNEIVTIAKWFLLDYGKNPAPAIEVDGLNLMVLRPHNAQENRKG